MILILLGAPGAGKGTQAEALATATGAAHVATGDLFRAEIAAGSELGRSAASYIDAGKLVPDEITVGMISARLARADAATRVILDGFPRNAAQVAALDAAFASSGRAINAILLKVDVSVLTARLTGRRVCSSCGCRHRFAGSLVFVVEIGCSDNQHYICLTVNHSTHRLCT